MIFIKTPKPKFTNLIENVVFDLFRFMVYIISFNLTRAKYTSMKCMFENLNVESKPNLCAYI